ncbi:hypothetical protein Tco_0625679 [Tanacetum coccineum]|uniref:Uncharacterized protein n=1 Tax=Tanacetum coccineum TaxID=301880 RepID=A0ABQ4WHK1_9ASTR
MASFDYRLNPLYAIKECSSCGALYTADVYCLKGGLEDKILVPKSPQNCATCGDPVDGLYETNTFDNSLSETETFCFNLEEISSGSPTSYSDLSLPDYEVFCLDDDHIEKKSSGSTTTHSDISLSEYDSFIFDFYHEEFADELAHIISPPDLKCFYFKSKPDLGDLTSIDPGIREKVYTTNVNVSIEDDQDPLFVFVVWIFLAFLTICPDFEASRASGFVLQSLELHILNFIWEIQYPNLID